MVIKVGRYALVIDANANDKLRGNMRDLTDISLGVLRSTTTAMDDGNYHYAVTRYDGTDFDLWLDDAKEATINNAGKRIHPITAEGYIGKDPNGGSANHFKGAIDEVRISTNARSDSWINAEYENQKTDSTFLSIGIQGTYLAPIVKFDQPDKIMINHSDYVTLLNLGADTRVIIRNNDEPLSPVLVIDLTEDDLGVYRSFVTFSDSLSTNNATRTLNVSENNEVQVNFFDGTRPDTATIIINPDPTIQQYGDRTVNTDKVNCDDPGFGGDMDKDGLCAVWEQDYKIVISNWDLDGDSTTAYEYECQGGMDSKDCTDEYRDIFVEIDYMQGHRPNTESLEQIRTSFLNAPAYVNYPADIKNPGIYFHYQIDDVDSHYINHDDDTFFPGLDNPALNQQGFDQLKTNFFGHAIERGDPLNTYWDDEGMIHKKQIFRYALFIHETSGKDISAISEGSLGK